MMKRYNSYKDSGVEWIGEIPSHWVNSKYKFHTNILSGFPFKSDLFDNVEGFPILRIRDITSGSSETFYKGDYQEEYVVKKGDLLIGMDGDFNIRWWNNYDVLLNQRCCSIKEFESVYRRFLFYVLPFDLKVINDLTYYTTVKHLSNSDIYNSSLVIPPLSEQQQIVSFLDTKTALIDSLIEKTQQKIELLKEKRTALINEVVSGKLVWDGNAWTEPAEVKDSGVEWIGEIPSHWEITKMKYGVNYISEKGKPEKTDIKISPENVESDSGVCFNFHSEHESEGMKFQKGDILFNKLRLYLKKILFAEYDGFSLGEMIVLRTNSKLNNKYFYQLLFSQGLIDLLDSQSTGIKLPRVSPDVILNTEIIFPPLSEQHQIVSYLDEQTQLIDKTISIEKRRIERLKEYRQSLISEVVTGKQKVVNDE